jgi:hypothetical protein
VELLVKDSTLVSSEEEKEIYLAAHYLAGLTLSSLDEMFVSAKKIMDWLAKISFIVAEQVVYFLVLYQFFVILCRIK